MQAWHREEVFWDRAPQITACALPNEKCAPQASIVPRKKVTGPVPLEYISGPVPLLVPL